jgi:hypothetical protein
MWAVIGLAGMEEPPKAESLKAELDKVIVTEGSADKEVAIDSQQVPGYYFDALRFALPMHGLDVRLLLYCFIAVVIATLVFRPVLAWRRTRALSKTAQEFGFPFKAADQGDGAELIQMGPLLVLGLLKNSRQYENIMTGTFAGLKTSLFDFRAQTVAAYSQDVYFPYFKMGPQTSWALDRVIQRAIESFFPKVSHDFESHPDFSRRYSLVWSLNDQRKNDELKELFSPALLTFLLELPPQNKWHIEGAGAVLIVFRKGKTVRVGEFRSFLDETSTIARAFFILCGLRKPAA